VGVGPRGPDGLTPAAIKEIVLAGTVFVDDFTAMFPQETFEFFQRTRRDPILRVGRERLERATEVLETAASPGGAALLVPGDPMAATTHISLRVEAERRGIPTRLIFAPSIIHMAFSEIGLQHYKAGRTVTIPYPEKGYAPTSPIERIDANRAAGLHSLVLLDIRSAEGRYMTANDGIKVMLQLSAKLPGSPLGPSTVVAAVARAGEPDCRKFAGSASRLSSIDFGPPMHCLIIPGKLHFEEREALKVLGGAREDELPPPL
jgi:diphthine synthase